MKIEMTPEQINAMFTSAIAESVVGEKLRQQMDKTVEDLCRGYNNPFENILKSMVTDLAKEIVETEMRDKIRDKVKERLDDQDKMDSIITNIVNKLTDPRY